MDKGDGKASQVLGSVNTTISIIVAILGLIGAGFKFWMETETRFQSLERSAKDLQAISQKVERMNDLLQSINGKLSK